MSDEIKLLIATHTHGSVTPAYAQSLATATAFLAGHGVAHAVMMFEDSLVDRGRDRAAATLLESDCTHLLFIDADIEFRPEAIVRLLACGKDLIAATYRKKNERDEFAVSFLDDAETHLDQCEETGAVKIARVGTGFMMIRRRVFERLAEEMGEAIAYHDYSAAGAPRPMWAFFEHVVAGGRRWSEDYTFCERWRAIGGDVWLDPYTDLGHWGPHAWRGSILQHMRAADETASAA
jgi:hypothetical protein